MPPLHRRGAGRYWGGGLLKKKTTHLFPLCGWAIVMREGVHCGRSVSTRCRSQSCRPHYLGMLQREPRVRELVQCGVHILDVGLQPGLDLFHLLQNPQDPLVGAFVDVYKSRDKRHTDTGGGGGET